MPLMNGHFRKLDTLKAHKFFYYFVKNFSLVLYFFSF
jgi:hypothetical protein